VAPASCTVLYKQLMTCIQPILQKKIRICLISKPLLTPGSSVQVNADAYSLNFARIKKCQKRRCPYFSILRGHCLLPFFDTIKYKPDRAFRTFSNLQIHAPGSDQMYSGVKQLPMCTQHILNGSACPKTQIFETKCKQRIDNHNCQAQGGKNNQKLMFIYVFTNVKCI
jgi:hypothetical protein